jgi:hypothetical protein
MAKADVALDVISVMLIELAVDAVGHERAPPRTSGDSGA